MDSEEEKEKAFTVKDRRRFDSHGDRKEEESSQGASKLEEPRADAARDGAAVEKAGGGAQAQSAPDSAEDHMAEINFSSFVLSLATQALIQMGQMPGPEGLEVPVDKNAARQTIDILRMIERKTRGNLDANEEKLIKEVLQNIQMSFVSVAGL